MHPVASHMGPISSPHLAQLCGPCVVGAVSPRWLHCPALPCPALERAGECSQGSQRQGRCSGALFGQAHSKLQGTSICHAALKGRPCKAMLSNAHSFSHLFSHALSFVFSLSHLVTHSVTHSFSHALIHFLIHSVTHLLSHSFSHSQSFIFSFTQSLIQSLILACSHSHISQSLSYSFFHVASLLHSFSLSLIHSVTHSLSLTHSFCYLPICMLPCVKLLTLPVGTLLSGTSWWPPLNV